MFYSRRIFILLVKNPDHANKNESHTPNSSEEEQSLNAEVAIQLK